MHVDVDVCVCRYVCVHVCIAQIYVQYLNLIGGIQPHQSMA